MPAFSSIILGTAAAASGGLSVASQLMGASSAKKASKREAILIQRQAEEDVRSEGRALSETLASGRAAAAAAGQGKTGSFLAVQLENVFESIRAQRRIRENARLAAAGVISQGKEEARRLQLGAASSGLGTLSSLVGMGKDFGLFKGGSNAAQSQRPIFSETRGFGRVR